MRITRAALRAQAQEVPQLIYEDTDADSFHNSPDANANRDLNRPPLKDITRVTNPPTNEDPFTDDQTAPMKKAKGKKNGRLAKKDKSEEPMQGAQEVEQDAISEETNDSSQTQSSDETLGSQITSPTASFENEANHDQSSILVEAGDATAEEHEHLDSTSTPQNTRAGPPKTPKFDPIIHRPVEGIATPAALTSEDSFVEKITSRTPGRLVSFQERNSPDTFLEQVTSRTSRIEDSVEAIDALEDAIEKVARTLPALDELRIDSPVKSREAPGTLKKPVPAPARAQRILPTKTRPAAKATAPSKTMTARPSTVKPAAKATVPTKLIKKPIVDGNKLRQSSALSAAAPPPPLSFSSSPAKSLPNTAKQRVHSGTLSTSMPAFVPAKSTKPSTKPTFTLPGEAISAKLKAQREERLKREEEAEKEKKLFKARPIPTKVARPSVVPRENKASQARMSIYANGVNKENVAPKPTIAPAPKPRPSSLDAKPKTSEAASTKANSGVRRTTTAAIVSKPRVPSIHLTSGQKSAVTKEDALQMKAKGKEVFGRTKAEMERAEKERKEKEEAARKARAEAAERGRQASREWAEKQKKKIASQAQAKILAGKAKDGSVDGTGHAGMLAAAS